MTRQAPIQPAKNYNMKTIKKGLNNKEFIVAKKLNGIKYWKLLKPLEKKCIKMFKKKLSTNLGEYKKGIYKSSLQAVAITFNQVLKKNPKCEKYIVSKKSKKSKSSKK